MLFPEEIEAVRSRFAHMGKGGFEKRFSDAFLVVEMAPLIDSTREFRTLQGTQQNAERPTEPIDKKSGKPVRSYAYQLVKSDRNSFHNMITLGRASNNDLVIPHPSVSKFHAFFRKEPKGYVVEDAGSTFGTTVNGVPVEHGEARPVQSGAVLILAGALRATFLDPGDFYDYLNIRSRMGP